MRPIKKIILHHSASGRDTTTIKDIERWHLEKKYNGIGYHLVIEGGGLLRTGRPYEKIGAHAQGFNTGSIGICLTGNFEEEEPDEEQIKQLVQVLATLCKRHGLPVSAIVGHRDVNKTACPGKNLYKLLPLIRQKVAVYLK